MKTFKFGDSKIYLHHNDLPQSIEKPKLIAVDTETTGLSLKRDRLCLAQLAFPNEECHLVKFDKDFKSDQCKNLIEVLNDKSILKVFHYHPHQYYLNQDLRSIQAEVTQENLH